MDYIIDKCKRLKDVEGELMNMSALNKNRALKEVAEAIDRNRDLIIKANEEDMTRAREEEIGLALLDRLMLDNTRIDSMIAGLETVISFPDPIWQSNKVWTLENGLTISKMSVPLGTIGIIYESRPNVTVDAFSLAFKSGNGIILRGSSSALNSNRALVAAIREGLDRAGVSSDLIQFVDDPSRDHVKSMLEAEGYIDLLIPRGGKGLIRLVVDGAKVPTLETGAGLCHIYVEDSADLDRAVDIVENAKVQRPGVCNACETLLVKRSIAREFLPKLYERLGSRVELVGSEDLVDLIPMELAREEDWSSEYLGLKLAIKSVDNVDEAIRHINKYSTKHSESILSEDYESIMKFTKLVDSSSVYVNASTRFTDGGEFGFGAEMGISTQKTHARGPVGLDQLVIYKYVILGTGQIRK